MPRILPSQTLERYESKKKVGEIVIPAWNDIIHLAPRPSYTSRELNYMQGIGTQVDTFGRSLEYAAEFHGLSVRETSELLDMSRERKEEFKRLQDIARSIANSPTPALAKNFGVIMTALDDVQDFTTTVGVLSRLLGRVVPGADLLAIGAFTVGEYLNRLNLVNRLTGGEISRICRLMREMGKASVRTRVKADVDKRMKRLFPSKGEIIEIAQTTDMLFGVGISLGPIVGLVQDLFFGAFTGAPIRFREWKISEKEKMGLLAIFSPLYAMAVEDQKRIERDMKYGESAANVVIGAEHVDIKTFLKSLVTSIQSGLGARAKEVKKAVIDSWGIISGQKAVPKKKTSIETRLLLSGMGVDPYAIGEWPVDGLGAEATLQEIMEAYSAQAQKVLHFWRDQLGVSDEGLFLDACVKEISLHAASMFCDEDGAITETLDPHTLIYIKALEANLNPPPDTSDEKFTEWISWILQQIEYYDIPVPTLRILQDAYNRFF